MANRKFLHRATRPVGWGLNPSTLLRSPPSSVCNNVYQILDPQSVRIPRVEIIQGPGTETVGGGEEKLAWLGLTGDGFRRLFSETPGKRIDYGGLQVIIDWYWILGWGFTVLGYSV